MALISVAVMVILSLEALIVKSNGACIYTETPGKRGKQLDWKSFSKTTDIAGCKAHCTSDTQCVAAEFHTSTTDCYLFYVKQSLSDDSTVTFIGKQCDPCSMDRTVNTKGGLTNVQLALASAEHCSSACLHVSQCQGVTYSGVTCKIYGGTASEANTGDSLNYYKQSCWTGTPCCMTSTTTFKADGAAMLTLTSSIASCESVCMMMTNCVSVYFANDVCYVYTNGTLTTTSAQTGSTYSTKTCTDTQTATGSITDVCLGARAGGSKPVHSLYQATSIVMLLLFNM